MINVTKPFLPDMEEYVEYLKGIWERNWLTNNGPLVNDLELKLKEYLGSKHLLFMGNGTIAIQIAIKALDLQGEIITTPFSFVATTSSIVWEGCEPVFVDIDKDTFNIDPSLIEKAITKKTTAILATHVFGNPCDIEAIEKIAAKHNLKVIYDAAHCFGSKYKGKHVFNYGDISTGSFHATKLYHTIEGGAVVTNDPGLLKKMVYLRNFGYETAETFACVGVNGKNSEFHAAMGLLNLKHMEDILHSRKAQAAMYDKELAELKVKKQKIQPGSEWNYSYYPVVFESEQVLLRTVEALQDNWIYPRRYFYPSLSSLNYVKPYATPVSDDIAKRILCLPMYHTLKSEEIAFISRILLRVQNNA
jgi:dTDP-4-amino-4,6-dideoxygalactose transaminase